MTSSSHTPSSHTQLTYTFTSHLRGLGLTGSFFPASLQTCFRFRRPKKLPQKTFTTDYSRATSAHGFAPTSFEVIRSLLFEIFLYLTRYLPTQNFRGFCQGFYVLLWLVVLEYALS